MSLIFVEIKQENIPTEAGIPRCLWLYKGGLNPTDQIMVGHAPPYNSVLAQPVLKRISFGDTLSIVSFTLETSIRCWSIGM